MEKYLNWANVAFSEERQKQRQEGAVLLYLNGAAFGQSCVVWAAQQIVRRSGNFNVFPTARESLQKHLWPEETCENKNLIQQLLYKADVILNTGGTRLITSECTYAHL